MLAAQELVGDIGPDGQFRLVAEIDRVADDLSGQIQRRIDLALGRGRCGLWDWDMARGRIYWSRSMYEMLGLPPGMMVLAIIGIGHPVETKAGHPRGALPFAQVSRERFGRRD